MISARCALWRVVHQRCLSRRSCQVDLHVQSKKFLNLKNNSIKTQIKKQIYCLNTYLNVNRRWARSHDKVEWLHAWWQINGDRRWIVGGGNIVIGNWTSWLNGSGNVASDAATVASSTVTTWPIATGSVASWSVAAVAVSASDSKESCESDKLWQGK